MSIADQITRIKTNVENAFAICADKGAIMPDVENSDYLASTIDTITGGGSGSTYGTEFASEVLEEVLQGDLSKTAKIDENILGVDVDYTKVSNNEYKPASISEYYQDILTCDNNKVINILTKTINGTEVAKPVKDYTTVVNISPSNATFTLKNGRTLQEILPVISYVGKLYYNLNDFTDSGDYELYGWEASVPPEIIRINGTVIQGNVSISDSGIATGFSGLTSYLSIPKKIPSSVSSGAIIFRANSGNLTSAHNALLQNKDNGYVSFIRTTNQSFSVWTGSWTTGVTTLKTNTWYWFGIAFDGSNYTGYVLEDDGSYIGAQEGLPDFSTWSKEWETSVELYRDKNLVIGLGNLDSEYWKGGVDLSKSFIYADGGYYWFGYITRTEDKNETMHGIINGPTKELNVTLELKQE